MNQLNNIARTLINYSLELKKGDKLVLENYDRKAGKLVYCIWRYCKYNDIDIVLLDNDVTKYVSKIKRLSDADMEAWAIKDLQLLKEADAYLRTSAFIGDFEEYSKLSKKKRDQYDHIYYELVHRQYRWNCMKWALTEIPKENYVSQINFDAESLKNYYYDLCNVDYRKMEIGAKRLVEILTKGKDIHIIGPNTDLFFSIEGLGAIPCIGKRNFPDGEVYTAPVKDSVNGHILYNVPSFKDGVVYENIFFNIKDGKIIDASCDGLTDKLIEKLDIDAGARYFGEFSFGINPLAIYSIGNTLIDEKIAGSFHLTPGCAYQKCNNGNDSSQHWDLVASQLIQNGGGQIYLDGELFRDNGYFIKEELQELNPILIKK